LLISSENRPCLLGSHRIDDKQIKKRKKEKLIYTHTKNYFGLRFKAIKIPKTLKETNHAARLNKVFQD